MQDFCELNQNSAFKNGGIVSNTEEAVVYISDLKENWKEVKKKKKIDSKYIEYLDFDIKCIHNMLNKGTLKAIRIYPGIKSNGDFTLSISGVYDSPVAAAGESTCCPTNHP